MNSEIGTDVLYHGTNGDNILSIARTGQMLPGADGKIFFARYNWANALMHGTDARRKASCVIKVRAHIPAQAVREHMATHGVADTLVVHTMTSLKVEILEMHVRLVVGVGEPVRGRATPAEYFFKHLKGVGAIVAWLGADQPAP